MAVYESMKESGIEWIGKIPATWKTHTLYQLVTQVKNKNSDLSEQNLLSLSYGKIKRKDINSNGGLLPESFNGYNIIEDGDIVLRLTDLQNDHTSLRVGRATERGIITSAYTTLRPIIKDSSKYLYYLLHCFDIKKGFYGMGSGVRQGLNYDEVKELRVIMPSSSTEQSAIAAYLDDQCAKIDTLISEAKASIEEYKQWKASLIFEAVTKGLDPNVDMKDSGSPAIGIIPCHWKIYNFKRICTPRKERNTGGRELLSVYLNRGVIPYSESTGMQVHKPSDNLDNYQNVNRGDFVLNNQQAWRGSVGISEYDGIISPAYYVYQLCNLCLPEYFAYLVRDISMVQQYELSSRGVGTIQRNIYEPWLQKITVPVPPLDEQREISVFLSSKCAYIESLIVEKDSLIKDLIAYRHSLIYEVTTGKRKVV